MSVLVVVLPARAAGVPASWRYVLSDDGRQPREHGEAAAALLPRADQRVLLLAEGAVAWHRVTVPKAPAARLRAALAGVLEEQLLDDEADLHLALAADATAGAAGWVAATARAPLAAALAALEAPEAGGRAVDRVVALLEPRPAGATAEAHVHPATADAQPDDLGGLALAVATADGAADLPLDGALAREWIAAAGELRVTAAPAAAATAERWLGASVAARTDDERWLEAAARGSNLRQFDLAPRHRGTRALGEALRRLGTPAWRPVRWGLAALAAVQLVGLNAQAWQARERIAERRAGMASLLQQSFPGTRVVIEPPLQMQRETERLRAVAGRAGPGDLETLLAVAAEAWPDGAGPAESLRFEPGRLVLGVPGWAEPEWQQVQERLRGRPVQAEFADAELRLAPLRPGSLP